MDIIQVNEEPKGFFKALEGNVEAGRMTYTWAGPDKIIIDHTEVNNDFSGKGIGKKLVLEAVKFARTKNIKILPLCPFAKKVFDETEDIQDVLF